MIQFTVEGDPAPKGSRTMGRTKSGVTFNRPSSARQKPWESAVATAAVKAMAERGPLEPPYDVTLHVRRRKPKRPSWPWPSREDLDKVVRCTIDGLVKGELLVDDRHVIRLTATEDWVGPEEEQGCGVQVRSIGGPW